MQAKIRAGVLYEKVAIARPIGKKTFLCEGIWSCVCNAKVRLIQRWPRSGLVSVLYYLLAWKSDAFLRNDHIHVRSTYLLSIHVQVRSTINTPYE